MNGAANILNSSAADAQITVGCSSVSGQSGEISFPFVSLFVFLKLILGPDPGSTNIGSPNSRSLKANSILQNNKKMYSRISLYFLKVELKLAGHKKIILKLEKEKRLLPGHRFLLLSRMSSA